MNIKTLQKELEEQFQWFHAHPELSYEEFQTTEKIKSLLIKQGIEILDLPLETGLVAVIRGSKPGPVIALRSDIDALPIQEETSLPWKSTQAGKMHACGHDFHITTLYGTALLLKAQEETMQGTIKCIFQPAEESSIGALKITETGVLDDVEAIFGIHSSSEFPVGTVGIKPGSVTAAVDRFEVEINGFGTHAAHPHGGKDPIIAATAIVQALQTITSRNIDPCEAGLLSITEIRAGNTWNVIPETAYLQGTVRTLRVTERELYEKRVKEIVEFTAKAHDVQAVVHWHAGPPATNNDADWCGFAKELAKAEGLQVGVPISSLGGEDFAFYQEQIKGVFIRIGTGDSYPNHHPKFTVDQKALGIAAQYLSVIGVEALKKIAKGE